MIRSLLLPLLFLACSSATNGMGRSSFDKAYMAEMVERQNEEVRLIQGSQPAGGCSR